MRRKEQPGGGASRQTPYSVLVVDDAELMRRGIAAIVAAEPDFIVCGLAGDEAAQCGCWDVISLIFFSSICRLVIAMGCSS